MNDFQKFLIVFLGIVFIHNPLFSQEISLEKIAKGKVPLTPRLAVKLGLENNPTLKKLQEQINQKKAERYVSYGVYSPQISYFKEGIPIDQTNKFEEQRITLSQDLDFPLTSIYRHKLIDDELRSLDFQLNWKKKEIIAQIKQTYSRIVYALDLIRLRTEIKDVSEQILNIVKTKVEFGQSNNLELLNAEIILEEAKNDLDDAVRKLMNARYELFFLLGLDPEYQEYSIAFQDSLAYFEFSIDQEKVLENITKTLDYQSVLASETAAQTNVKLAWSSLFPNINLNIYQQNYADGFNHFGFEVGLRVPLWFGLDKRTEIIKSRSKLVESQIHLFETTLRIKKEIEHAWHNFDVSREIIQRYTKNILEKSKNLLDLTLESYRLGRTDLMNLLYVQKSYINSKIGYLDALLDYYTQIIELEKYLDFEVVFTN